MPIPQSKYPVGTVLDATGAPFRPRAQGWAETAHLAASLMAPELARWNPNAGSPDGDLLGELDTLRARSRDLARNSGIATGALQTIADNVVGLGLRLNAMPNWRVLGRDADWADEWASVTEAHWRDWADTPDCDAARELTFAGLTMQVFRGSMLNGEGLGLPKWKPDRGTKYATCVQVMEADRLGNPDGRTDTVSLRGGVEVDLDGEPQAYHISQNHPGDELSGLSLGGPRGWTRIPARTAWGRLRVIHVHDKERSGSTRGKPILSAVIPEFRMITKYKETELKAAIVNAMIAAFIKTTLPDQTMVELLGGDEDRDIREVLAERNSHRVPLQGGMLLPLAPGEEVQSFLPTRPAGAFTPFVETGLLHIAAGLSIPYELLLKDFRKTTYSSARAALLEAWRFFIGRRAWLATHWCQPVYELWLEEAVSKGMIKAPGFYENRRAYCRSAWIGPGKGWIDPVKEAQGAKLRIDALLSTWSKECAEQGLDFEEVLEGRTRESKRIAAAGLSETVPDGFYLAGAPADQEGQGNQERKAA